MTPCKWGSLYSRFRPAASVMRIQGSWPSSAPAYQSMRASNPSSSSGGGGTSRLWTQVSLRRGRGMAFSMRAKSASPTRPPSTLR